MVRTVVSVSIIAVAAWAATSGTGWRTVPSAAGPESESTGGPGSRWSLPSWHPRVMPGDGRAALPPGHPLLLPEGHPPVGNDGLACPGEGSIPGPTPGIDGASQPEAQTVIGI